MQINVNVIVSGSVHIVHDVAPGTPPPATSAELKALGDQLLANLDEIASAIEASPKNIADLAELKRKLDGVDRPVPSVPPAPK